MEYRVYESYVPRRFVLDSGEVVTLPAEVVEDSLVKEPLFLLWVPSRLIEVLHAHLLKMGFEEAFPSLPKGEVHSVRRLLEDPWELHLRIYADGFIESEVEVRREFVEHLGDRRMYVVYEAFEFYRDLYDTFHVYYRPSGKWVVKVLENFRVRVRPPQSLTPWKPVVAGVAALATVGLLIYALNRFSRA